MYSAKRIAQKLVNKPFLLLCWLKRHLGLPSLREYQQSSSCPAALHSLKRCGTVHKVTQFGHTQQQRSHVHQVHSLIQHQTGWSYLWMLTQMSATVTLPVCVLFSDAVLVCLKNSLHGFITSGLTFFFQCITHKLVISLHCSFIMQRLKL